MKYVGNHRACSGGVASSFKFVRDETYTVEIYLVDLKSNRSGVRGLWVVGTIWVLHRAAQVSPPSPVRLCDLYSCAVHDISLSDGLEGPLLSLVVARSIRVRFFSLSR